MEVKILSEDKSSMEVEIGSLTIAEVLRVYIAKEGVDMVAWKRDHPTKNPVLRIEASNPKKVFKKALDSLDKDLDKVVDDFKKLK